MILLFDYDGTIHQSDATYVPAFRATLDYLEKQGHGIDREVSNEEIGYWLGFSAKDMWNQFAPDFSEELKDECSKFVGEEMRRLTREGKAQVYPGVLDTLVNLRNEGHKLLFVSNCHHSYMEMHSEAFDLGRYFDGFYCCEDYGWIPKADIFPSIREDWGGDGRALSDFMMIGDRFHDMELARKNGIKSVGCAYGFGAPEEIERATAIAQSPADLLSAIHDAMKS